MLLKLVYVEVTQITNSKGRGGGGGGLAEIKRKRKVVLIIFAEVCWIFVSEGYIG